MISRLSAIGLKGSRFTDALAPVTIWTGGNSAGKSARLDCVHLCVSAKHPDPGIGGTNAGIMALSDGRHLHVEMDYGEGAERHTVTRHWTAKKDGFSCDNSDACKDFSAVLLNPRLYFALSAAKQVEYVASLVSISDPAFTPAGLVAAVKNIRLDSGSTEASETAINGVCDCLRKIQPADPLPWLENALAIIKVNLSTANATKKRMAGVVTGLEQLRAADTAAAASTGTVERDLKAERDKFALLAQDEGHLKGRVTAAARARSRREALEAVKAPAGVNEAALVATRDELSAKIGQLTKAAQERPVNIMELRGTIACCQAKQGAAAQSITAINRRITLLETVKAPATGQNQDAEYLGLKKLVEELKKRIASREYSTDFADAKVLAFHQHLAEQRANYTVAKSQVEQLYAEIEKFMACDHCPTCLATGGDWQARWREEQEKKIADLKTKMDTATVAGTQLKTALAKAAQIGATMRSEDEGLRCETEKLTAIEQSIRAIAAEQQRYAATQEELAQARKDRDQQDAQADFAAAKIKEVQPSFDAWLAADKDLEGLRLQHNNAVTLLDSAAAALTQFKAAQAELTTMIPPEAQATLGYEQVQLVGKVVVAKTRIAELEQQQRGIIAQRASIRSQMQAAESATATEAQIEVLKATADLLKEKQGALVTRAFKPLLAIANRFTDGILPGTLDYKDGVLGYEAGGTFVGSATFNTAYQVLAFLGLAAALSQGAKEKLVLFDEMARLDAPNKVKVVERMLAMVKEGVISQFLGNDLEPRAYWHFGDNIKIISV